jgi:hypothetical protein
MLKVKYFINKKRGVKIASLIALHKLAKLRIFKFAQPGCCPAGKYYFNISLTYC